MENRKSQSGVAVNFSVFFSRENSLETFLVRDCASAEYRVQSSFDGTYTGTKLELTRREIVFRTRIELKIHFVETILNLRFVISSKNFISAEI